MCSTKMRLLFLFIFLNGFGLYAQNTISLNLADAESKNPIAYAMVKTAQSSVYYMSNEEGTVLIPSSSEIEISHISYFPKKVENIYTDTIIYLEARPVLIKEVTVMSLDAQSLVQKAIEKIPAKYHAQTQGYRCFYREEYLVKDNLSYKQGYDVVEALLKINHQGYSKKASKDQSLVMLEKSRRVELDNDFFTTDSALNKMAENQKIKGGVFNCLDYDLHSTDAYIFFKRWKKYSYSYSNRYDENYYIINFLPIEKEKSVYGGEIFIHKNSGVIKSISYKRLKPYKSNFMGIYLAIEDRFLSINFEEFFGEWHPVFIQNGIHFRIKMKSKNGFVDMDLKQTSTLSVSEVSEKMYEVEPQKVHEKNQKIFESVDKNYDPKFWEKESILLPSIYKKLRLD